MAKRKWTSEEVEVWRQEHGRGLGYFNKEDSNIFVTKSYGFGWALNWASSVSWIIIGTIIAIIVWKALYS